MVGASNAGALRTASFSATCEPYPLRTCGEQRGRGEHGALHRTETRDRGQCEAWPPVGRYSPRSDSIGFTPLARRAGTQLATAPMASIISDIPANTSGSTACTS